MQVTDELATTEVLDLEGQPHPLGELWRERPAVLIYLRHYG